MPDFRAPRTLQVFVEGEQASDAVTWLESLGGNSAHEDVEAAIRNAARVAEQLDRRAQELHREIDSAIDYDVSAIGPLTRELRTVYFDRDRIRTALSRARVSWPQLFDRR